jgi:hypothetical protein
MRRNVVIVWVAAALLTCAPTVGASTWRLIDTAQDGSFALLVDTDSIQWSGAYKKAWIMKSYQKQSGYHGREGFYLSTKLLKFFDCQNRTYFLDQIIDYSEQAGRGRVIRSFRNPFEISNIVPDSLAEQEWQTVCSA